MDVGIQLIIRASLPNNTICSNEVLAWDRLKCPSPDKNDRLFNAGNYLKYLTKEMGGRISTVHFFIAVRSSGG
jgi:hypothetical protein